MKSQTALSALALFLIGVLFFSVSWNNPFVFDDIIKIQENGDLKPGASIAETLLYPYTQHSPSLMRNDPSRPLTFLIYRACYALGDGQPWPFHAASTLFHSLNAVFVFLLACLLARRLGAQNTLATGWLAALFFLLLPINSGTVLYAFAFSDVIASFFVLLTILIFANRPHLQTPAYILSLLLFAGALLSKQSAIVLPVLLFVIDGVLKQSSRKRLWQYGGFAILAFAYIALRFAFFGHIGDLEGTDNTFAPADYFLRQGYMILKYLQLSLVPLGLTIDHGIDPASISALIGVLSWAVVLSSAGAACYFLLRKSASTFARIISGMWIFFLISLAPTSSFVPTVDLFVERRIYLGSVALAVLFAWLLSLIPLKRAGIIGGSAILVLFTAVSWGRGQIYASPRALWQESAILYPTSKRALVNLAVMDDQLGNFENAKNILEAVTAQFPNDAFVHTKLALIYQNPQFSGYSPQKAFEEYKKALALTPNDLATLYNTGLLMIDSGNLDQAEALFRRSIEINPRFIYGYFGLGVTLVKKGHSTEGKAALEKALEFDPQFRPAQEQLQLLDKDTK